MALGAEKSGINKQQRRDLQHDGGRVGQTNQQKRVGGKSQPHLSGGGRKLDGRGGGEVLTKQRPPKHILEGEELHDQESRKKKGTKGGRCARGAYT